MHLDTQTNVSWPGYNYYNGLRNILISLEMNGLLLYAFVAITCSVSSLRVNLDMGKVVYSWMIQRDKNIPDTVVRSTTIPEELGRIQYLLSDKTGTLTQNEMVSSQMPCHSVPVAFAAKPRHLCHYSTVTIIVVMSTLDSANSRRRTYLFIQ